MRERCAVLADMQLALALIDVTEVAGGVAAWKKVLRGFWDPFQQKVSQTSGVSISEVIDMLDGEVCRAFLRPQACLHL